MTTFLYNGAIPNPPNDPAADVGTMQQNATSIGGIIAVDHVGFGTAGGGRHNQVTFNANVVPALPTALPIIFSNLPTAYGGTPTYPQPFVYSGTAAQSSGQYVLAGSGSALLVGGVIIKWGTFTMGAGVTTLNVAFASNFPNSKFSVVVSATSGGATDVISAQVDANLTRFTAVRAITTNLPYYYIAIGN